MDAEGAVQAPFRVYDPTLFSRPSPSAGGLLRGGKFAWAFFPSGLLSVYSSIGECVSQVKLVPSQRKGRRLEVSCSCELSLSFFPTRSRSLPLALAVSVEGVRAKTTLVLVDALSSSLLRAIEVPWTVSSLCGVSEEAVRAVTSGLFSSSILREFSGVLAAGCAGGHVILVDLALGVIPVGAGSLARPLQLVFVDSSQMGGGAVVSSTRSDGTSLACIDVLASHHEKGQFHYHSSSHSSTPRTYPTDSLAITALHFVPQTASLLIGYSMGSFQIFDVGKMAIVHGSPPPKVPVPVTHFGFQEPENDPKNNVYFWVARGNPPHADLKVESKLTLYQVLFANKLPSALGTTYQDFMRCGPGFIYPLTPTPTRPHPNRSHSSTLLLCHTPHLPRGSRELDESYDMAGGPDLTVSVFVWGCGDSAHKDYIVGVFDLNQYYHSQVPKMLQWRSLRKRSGLLGCSYFAFYSLKSMTNDSTIMDVAIVDVVQFLSSLPPIPETHLWPTSLSFNVTALTTEGFLRCSCLGLQRKALQELTCGDVAAFSCPQTIFSLCETADLLEPAWDLDHANREDQQKALLYVALDHDMKSLLLECAFTWFRGGGDTCFSVFVEWLRGTIKDLKIEKEHLCHLIFSGAADSAEKSSLLLEKLLMKYSHLSSLLTSLLSSLSPPHTLTQLSPHTLSAQFSEEPHVQELSGFYVNTATSQTVVQVVVWCLDNGVLPVATGGGEPILCSGSVLEQFYGRLRRKKDMCKLCVDYLCEEEVQIDGYHYPPDSLEDHLVIFTSTVSLAPHCLMIYFLMDLCTLRESDYDTTELLEEYCQEHHLPAPILTLTRALWELDHSHFQAAVEVMRGGALGSREWFPWQQLAIASHLSRSPATIISLTTLLAESDNVVQEPRLLLKVLVERRNIWDALNIIRSCDDDTIDELFQYFLDLCQEYKCLSELVKLPLTDNEDAVFCLYLEECPLFKAQELLVLHYAAHYRYGDAIKHQTKIRPQAMLDPVPGARERSLSRDSLLEPFKNTAPSVLRDLWNSATVEPPSPPTHGPRTRVRNPPLSSVLAKNEAANVASSVETIYQEMQNIRDAAEAEPVSSPFTVKDSICPSTPFFSHPPSVRKAILSRKKAAGVSAVQATPLAQDRPSRVSTPFQPPQTPGTASGLSSFQTHMERFRERMFQLSQTATNIDPSFIRTPPVRSHPLQSERSAVSTTVQAPPSILKVRSEKKLADEREGEGEVGEKGEGVTTETRRIRFAEDRMIFESSKASLTSTQPLRSVPVGPTAEAMAVATPLPSSDDSDLFYSFTDSPSPPPKPIRVSPSSQGTPSHPPRGTPSQSPLPKTKLFIGADDDYEESKQQQQSSAISTSELESTAVATTTVTTTTASPLKVRFPVLSRLGIGLHSSPLESGRSRAGGGFTPRHPSPLEHSLISRDFRGNLGRGTPRQSPLSTSREKEKKEKGSSIDFTGPSVTMVPVLTRDEEDIGSGWGSSAETTPTDPTRAGGGSGEEQTYSFSPGKVISAAPPVSEMSELKRTPLSRATGPVYAFSPPFTRSAARRAAAAAAMGTGDTGEGVREGGGRKETRGKREQSLASGRVDLVTPPSQHSTPATGVREGQRAKRKVALHSMATRSSRSTRLVQDKK